MASKPATKTKTALVPATVPKKSAKPAPAAAKKPVTPSARKAAPKPPAETVTLKTVFEQLAEGREMPKKQAHAMAAEMVELMTSLLKKGDRVRITGLGILEVKDRPARMGRNPATGASIQIAASKKVSFRVAKELKVAV
jgi:DNA-binding protein HU-beta